MIWYSFNSPVIFCKYSPLPCHPLKYKQNRKQGTGDNSSCSKSPVKDLEGRNYSLSPGSLSRDHRTDLGRYDLVLNGNPVVGNRDIVAYEYQVEWVQKHLRKSGYPREPPIF